MQNGKCTLKYELFLPSSFAAILGAKFRLKTTWSKCTHFPLWVHNKTIAQAFVLTIGLSL